ncbi:MAG: hypothetical protein ACLUTM_03370 [Streptococcus constellatus]
MKIYNVKVQFRDPFESDFKGRKYNYLSFEKLEVGDLVVVETIYGFSVAKVSDTILHDSYEAHSYVVAKIDTSELDSKKLKVAQAEMIKAEIEEKIREHLYVKQVSEFAQDDPELAELLSQLKTL